MKERTQKKGHFFLSTGQEGSRRLSWALGAGMVGKLVSLWLVGSVFRGSEVDWES